MLINKISKYYPKKNCNTRFLNYEIMKEIVVLKFYGYMISKDVTNPFASLLDVVVSTFWYGTIELFWISGAVVVLNYIET